MAINLGRPPDLLTVTLSRGGAFANVAESNQDWPDGTVIELRFSVSDTASPIVWPATITGAQAVWEVGPDDVATVIDTQSYVARLVLTYPGGYPWIWAKGKINAD